MKPQSCKAKGRRLQQLVVSDLLSMFPSLSEDDIRSTSMGAGGEDIQLSSAARRVIPYSFEAKNQERVNVWSAMEQCKHNTPSDADSVVVIKKNNTAPHVVLTWQCFKRLISRETASSTESSGDDATRRDRLVADLRSMADRIEQMSE